MPGRMIRAARLVVSLMMGLFALETLRREGNVADCFVALISRRMMWDPGQLIEPLLAAGNRNIVAVQDDCDEVKGAD